MVYSLSVIVLLFLIFENRVDGLHCLVGDPGATPKPESCATFCIGGTASFFVIGSNYYQCSPLPTSNEIINKMNKCSTPFEMSVNGQKVTMTVCFCDTDQCNEEQKWNTMERFTFTPAEIKKMEDRVGQSVGGSGGSNGGLQCLVGKPGTTPKPEHCSTFCSGVIAHASGRTVEMYECVSEAEAKDEIYKNKMNKCSTPSEISIQNLKLTIVFCACNTSLCNQPSELSKLETFTFTSDEIKELENRAGRSVGGSGGLQCLVGKSGTTPKSESCSTFCIGGGIKFNGNSMNIYACSSDTKPKEIENKMNKCSTPFEFRMNEKTFTTIFCACNTSLCNEPSELAKLETFTFTPDEIKEMQDRDGRGFSGSGGLQCLVGKPGTTPKPENCSTFCAGGSVHSSGRSMYLYECVSEAEAKDKIYENKMNKCSTPSEISIQNHKLTIVFCACNTSLCNEPSELSKLETFTLTPDEIKEKEDERDANKVAIIMGGPVRLH